jgi:membrane-associated phospholipid phosphatase
VGALSESGRARARGGSRWHGSVRKGQSADQSKDSAPTGAPPSQRHRIEVRSDRPCGGGGDPGKARPWPARIEALLPHGWADFLRQVAIWFAFVFGYQIARGLSDRGSAEAFRNARRLISLEERLGGLVELDAQRLVLDGGSGLVHVVNSTYWLSQFAAVGIGLVWIYFRRNYAYLLLRNTLIVTNTLGLIGYVAMPTAPPRLLPGYGFVDTLARSEVLNHGTGLVELVANPYAAMPSLHAADSLIIGVALAVVVRPPLLKALFVLFPLWVWFSLLATANHFWLDIVAGVVFAVLGVAVATRFTPTPTEVALQGR